MKAVYSTRIPKDALENGYEVLATVSMYYVDVAVKVDFLNGRKAKS